MPHKCAWIEVATLKTIIWSIKFRNENVRTDRDMTDDGTNWGDRQRKRVSKTQWQNCLQIFFANSIPKLMALRAFLSTVLVLLSFFFCAGVHLILSQLNVMDLFANKIDRQPVIKHCIVDLVFAFHLHSILQRITLKKTTHTNRSVYRILMRVAFGQSWQMYK